MSLRRAAIIALGVVGGVAMVQVADGADVPVTPKPAVERASEPRRAREPDAAERERLYQQFREWLQKRDQSDRGTELSASRGSRPARPARMPVQPVPPMFPPPPMLPPPPPIFPPPPPILPMPPLPPLFPGGR